MLIKFEFYWTQFIALEKNIFKFEFFFSLPVNLNLILPNQIKFYILNYLKWKKHQPNPNNLMPKHLKDQDLLKKKFFKSNKHSIYSIPMEEDQ